MSFLRPNICCCLAAVKAGFPIRLPRCFVFWSGMTLSQWWRWLPVASFSIPHISCHMFDGKDFALLFSTFTTPCLHLQTSAWLSNFYSLLFICSIKFVFTNYFIIQKASTYSQHNMQDPCVFITRDTADFTVCLQLFSFYTTCFPCRLYPGFIVCPAECEHHKLRAGKEAEKEEPPVTVGGMTNWCSQATVNISVKNSQRTKWRSTIWPRCIIPWHRPKDLIARSTEASQDSELSPLLFPTSSSPIVFFLPFPLSFNLLFLLYLPFFTFPLH